MFARGFILALLGIPVFHSIISSAKTDSINICLPSFREELTSLVIMTAQEQKMFERAGLDAKLTITLPSDDRPGYTKTDGIVKREELSKSGSALPLLNVGDRGVSKKVSSKNCHFGSTTIEQFLVADEAKVLNKTIPLLISSYSDGYDTNLVTAANSKIRTLKDLKGKRVRMGQIPNRLALETLLKKEGMGLADIEQVYGVGPSEVLAKLESGELDAAITYIPSMPYMLASGKVRVLKANLMSLSGMAPLPHSLVIANKLFAEQSPEVVKKFLSAMTEATNYLQRNPSQLVQVLARNTKVLGDNDWKIDNTIAERSGAFVGKLHVTNLSESDAARSSVAKDIHAYSEKLRAAQFFKKCNDLNGWIGAAKGTLKTASRN